MYQSMGCRETLLGWRRRFPGDREGNAAHCPHSPAAHNPMNTFTESGNCTCCCASNVEIPAELDTRMMCICVNCRCLKAPNELHWFPSPAVCAYVYAVCSGCVHFGVPQPACCPVTAQPGPRQHPLGLVLGVVDGHDAVSRSATT